MATTKSILKKSDGARLGATDDEHAGPEQRGKEQLGGTKLVTSEGIAGGRRGRAKDRRLPKERAPGDKRLAEQARRVRAQIQAEEEQERREAAAALSCSAAAFAVSSLDSASRFA